MFLCFYCFIVSALKWRESFLAPMGWLCAIALCANSYIFQKQFEKSYDILTSEREVLIEAVQKSNDSFEKAENYALALEQIIMLFEQSGSYQNDMYQIPNRNESVEELTEEDLKRLLEGKGGDVEL